MKGLSEEKLTGLTTGGNRHCVPWLPRCCVSWLPNFPVSREIFHCFNMRVHDVAVVVVHFYNCCKITVLPELLCSTF